MLLRFYLWLFQSIALPAKSIMNATAKNVINRQTERNSSDSEQRNSKLARQHACRNNFENYSCIWPICTFASNDRSVQLI